MTGLEKCDVGLSFSSFSTSKERRLIWARKAEVFFNNVRANCEAKKMQVNDLKTQLICVTSAINYELRSFIRLPGHLKESGDSLKVVGFTFGRRPGASEHIKALRKSYGARAWILRHLKRAGIDSLSLIHI